MFKGATLSQNNASILIVDDTPANIEVLNEILRHEFKTYFALNGSDALHKAGIIMPDLILLDVMMPGIDGFEVCRRLKEEERFREVPVIFITALGQSDEESRGLRLGAADYITKPFNPELVLLRVRNHIELKNRRDALEQRTMELEKALAEIRTLQGVIPICASCKKIRDDHGSWTQLEIYIREHSGAEFSHGICPGCAKELYPVQYARMYPEES
jgi:PleD family two-component response regulator